jgi:hypothetical protein
MVSASALKLATEMSNDCPEVVRVFVVVNRQRYSFAPVLDDHGNQDDLIASGTVEPAP